MDYSMYLNERAEEYTIPQEEFEALLETKEFLRRSHQDKILLREENEKLKEEIKELKEQIEEEVDTSLGACEKIVEMRQFCMNIHNLMYGTRFDDEDIVSSFDFPLILKRLERDEYEKEGMPYIKKNLELREKIINHQDEVIEHLKTIKKLRLDEEKLVEATIASYREIRDLKVEKEELKRWVDRNQAEIDRLRLVIDGEEELKEEIQELKEKYEGELITQEEFVKRSQASE